MWFNKLIGRFKIAAAMKASTVTRALGTVAVLLVLALQPAAFSATANEDRAIAQQKAVIEEFDAARKEYLKTGDLAQFGSKLDQFVRDESAH